MVFGTLVGRPRGPDDDLATTRYVAKHKRKTKGEEIVFDPAAHRDFITGFRKRKQQRRKDALAQIKEKERAARLQERAEKRQALKAELGFGDRWGDSSDEEEGGQGEGGGGGGGGAGLGPSSQAAAAGAVKQTKVFAQQGTVTTVNIAPIDMHSDDPADCGSDEEEGGEGGAGEEDGGEEAPRQARQPPGSRPGSKGGHKPQGGLGVKKQPMKGGSSGGGKKHGKGSGGKGSGSKGSGSKGKRGAGGKGKQGAGKGKGGKGKGRH